MAPGCESISQDVPGTCSALLMILGEPRSRDGEKTVLCVGESPEGLPLRLKSMIRSPRSKLERGEVPTGELGVNDNLALGVCIGKDGEESCVGEPPDK